MPEQDLYPGRFYSQSEALRQYQVLPGHVCFVLIVVASNLLLQIKNGVKHLYFWLREVHNRLAGGKPGRLCSGKGNIFYNRKQPGWPLFFID
jgi:hypothetical protein